MKTYILGSFIIVLGAILLALTAIPQEDVTRKVDINQENQEKNEDVNSKVEKQVSQEKDKKGEDVNGKQEKQISQEKVSNDETIEFFYKLEDHDDASIVKDFDSNIAHSSIEEAIKNPLPLKDSSECGYKLTLLLVDLKDIKICYERMGKLKTVKFNKKTQTAVLENLSGDFGQDQYIVQIQCNKGTFFIYTDTQKRSIKENTGEIYFAGKSKDYHQTHLNFSPIEFSNTLNSPSIIVVPSGLSEYGINLIFYIISDKKFTIKIYDSEGHILKSKIQKDGRLSIFAIQGIASDIDDASESYYITFATKEESKFLKIVNDYS